MENGGVHVKLLVQKLIGEDHITSVASVLVTSGI